MKLKNLFYQDDLAYKPVVLSNKYKLSIIILLLFCIFGGFSVGYTLDKEEVILERESLIVLLNEEEAEAFTPTLLYDYLKQINIKFPDIVFAQAVLESGSFKSDIFKRNHNLFGMKQAYQRPTMSTGTERGHATFNNWKESCVDMAYYQIKYLSVCKTEKEYFQYLKLNYAEDPNYISKVKFITKDVNSYLTGNQPVSK